MPKYESKHFSFFFEINNGFSCNDKEMEISKITLHATSSNMILDILKINIIISITLHLVQNNLLTLRARTVF